MTRCGARRPWRPRLRGAGDGGRRGSIPIPRRIAIRNPRRKM